MAKKKKEATTTALTVISAPIGLAKIEERLKALSEFTDVVWKTDGQFGGGLNIRTTTEENLVVKADATLRLHEDSYNQSAEKYYRTKDFPEFTYNGNKASDWYHDFQARFMQITIKDEVTRLKNGKAKLAKFLSEKEQMESIFEDLNLKD